ERSQVDVGGSVLRIHVENLQVDGNRFALRRRILFQLDSARKQVDYVGDDQFRTVAPGAGHNFRFVGGEVEHELSSDGLKQPAAVPECHAVPALIGARFQQRILHSRHLLQHGVKRLRDYRRTHSLAAQVADFLDLQEIEKGIILARLDQTRLLPCVQLARSEPENAQQVETAVAIHKCEEVRS